MALSAEQSKAARALLGWSQTDLAHAAKIGVSTVADFERKQRSPAQASVEAIQLAFEDEGLTLDRGGVVVGATPHFATASAVRTADIRPVRWIDETALSTWAARIDARDAFPELVRRLLLARFGYSSDMRFPSGEAVQLPGWDGLTNFGSTEALIPSGPAGWELGVSKDVRAKAESDFAHRAKNPAVLDPAVSTFVFVTPRSWPQKEEWCRAKIAQGPWRSVKVIDAVDLVQLLEQTPAVALWLAEQTSAIPRGVSSLPDAWREWAYSTERYLSENLVLAGRDEQSALIHRWLHDGARPLAFQAESTAEANAFLFASISEYPPDIRDAYLSRVLVVASPDTARKIANVRIPLVLSLSEMDPGIAGLLASRGHHVFQAFGSAIGVPTNVERLARPTRYDLEAELAAMRLPEEEASQLARDAGGSLTAMRRLMKAAPGVQPPCWARSDEARKYLPALFVGAWDDANDEDHKIIERISGIGREEFRRHMAEGLLLPESPLRQVGSVWKVASPRDAWFRLSDYLTQGDIERFRDTALEVLSRPDPAFAKRADPLKFAIERPSFFSSYLRKGIIETLVLIGVFGSLPRAARDLDHLARDVVLKLLDGAAFERWWSVSDYLKELAEADPSAFLEAVERSLDLPDHPVVGLFEEPGDMLFGGGSRHSDLLWALEMLAWSPEYLARVTDLLLRLTELDPGGRLGNRPSRSLRQIYLPWLPQTNATQDERFEVLDAYRGSHADVMWRLILDLYPRGHDTSQNSPRPLWRTFDWTMTEEIVTNRSVWESERKLAVWIAEDVGEYSQRWLDVVSRFGDFSPDLRARIIERADGLAARVTDPERVKIADAIRRFIHRHRKYASAAWTLPDSELAQLELVYRDVQSEDPVERVRWLFCDYHAPLISDFDDDESADASASRRARATAFAGLCGNQSTGTEAALILSNGATREWLIGQAIVDALPRREADETINQLLRVDDDVAREIALGALATADPEWIATAAEVMDRARQEEWSDISTGAALSALPHLPDILDVVSGVSPSIQDSFWRRVNAYALRRFADRLDVCVRALLKHQREYQSLALADDGQSDLSGAVLVEVLEALLQAQERWSEKSVDTTMLSYHVERLFSALDKRSEIKEEQLAGLEWAYLAMLERSSRPPRLLYNRMSSSPDFFVQVLASIYRADKEEKPDEPDDEDDDEERSDDSTRASVARNAFRLLNSWAQLPGELSGTIDSDQLNAWVDEVRRLCATTGRKGIADQKIGEVFAYSRPDADGSWPTRPVRDVIERLKSKDIETGFYIGVRNSRGVTTRGVFDGGEQERDEATKYRAFAKRVRIRWPRTAGCLETIARSYEHDAKHHDKDAARRQW